MKKENIFAPSKLNTNEKNISAIAKEKKEQTRFQGKNVNSQRPPGIIIAQGCRQEKTNRFRRKTS
jgi:hypothetical protein